MRQIIFVDDDPGIQKSMHMLLTRFGFDVTVHSNGQSLLNNDFEPPSLFILDKQLSGIDGLALCRHLKKDPATHNIPVIVLSASPMVEKLAIAAGADSFLEKPFRMMALKSIIDALLNPS